MGRKPEEAGNAADFDMDVTPRCRKKRFYTVESQCSSKESSARL
jgi:hypothetical protein